MDFDLLDILTALFLTVGCFLGISGGVGLYRLPDFFSRQHATGVTDSACSFLILFALILQSGFTLVSVKLCFIFFFLVITSTTATHALAKSALHKGITPILGREDKR
ncbi:MAG: monovalent cation/H(+) antiporter subunit G [Desulfuromonas sp.]|jgi:multicomponent Na+:H+ antiporter subunit G|nr:monovalent cation/H(+) antiporter subunit G [Desulfuromonas sp.]